MAHGLRLRVGAEGAVERPPFAFVGPVATLGFFVTVAIKWPRFRQSRTVNYDGFERYYLMPENPIFPTKAQAAVISLAQRDLLVKEQIEKDRAEFDAKTATLRALRLARDAAAPPPPPAPRKQRGRPRTR